MALFVVVAVFIILCARQSVSYFSKPANRFLHSQIYSNLQNSGDNYVLQQQFMYLANDKGVVTLKKFLESDEIQSLLDENLFELNEFKAIWVDVVGNLKQPCSLDQFIKINIRIDDEFEDENDEEENNQVCANTVDPNSNSALSEDNFNFLWSAAYDPVEAFDSEFLTYLHNFYNSNSYEGRLNYTAFMSWNDVKELLSSGNVDTDIMKDLWLESYEKTNAHSLKISTYSVNEALASTIDFDVFLRVNLRLNSIIEEIDEAISALSDTDLNEYYLEEFLDLVKSGSPEQDKTALLTLKQLLSWRDLKDTMKDCDLSKEDIIQIWNTLDLQPLPLISKGFGGTSPTSLKGSSSVESMSFGINQSEFITFNQILTDYLKSAAPPAPINWDPN